ncbi:MAG: UPF0182 family protein [Clostridiales bacterium]|nr:UPF0182 family protein [Candidatus Crickella merdequi]
MFNKRAERKEARQLDKTAKRRQGRKGLSVIIMLIALIILCFIMLVGFLTDWLWFKDLGYTSVFWKKLVTEIEIGVPVFIITGLLMRFYLRTLKNGYFRDIESHEIPNEKNLNRTSWILSAIFALLVAVFCSTKTWLEALQFLNSTGFKLKDPLFNLDISFYIFKLEYLTQINNIVLAVIIGMVAVTLLYYSILLAVRTPDVFKRKDSAFDEEEEEETYEEVEEDSPLKGTPFEGTPFDKMMGGRKAPFGARKAQKKTSRRTLDINENNMHHLLSIASGKLTLLGIVFYLMLGVEFFLRQFNLLHAHTGAVYGAGFTDVNITLWVYRIIILLSLVGAATIGVHIKKKNFKGLTRIPIAMIIIFALGTGIGMLVQNLVVSPDEINKESKYLDNNITYTRYAYDLNDITVESYSADNSLSSGVIGENQSTVSNVRINDYQPVEQFYNQTQSIRQYYHFNDVDIDRYKIGDIEYQTYLSAREIDESKISDTWLNKHLKYTHGYGAAVSQVNTVTSSGQPDVIVGNIPPESNEGAMEITRPEIYFGELTDDYIIVNTKEQEFDYPDGSSNQYTEYEGTSGIKLNLINRILYTIREGSIKILVSGNITSNSRIIYTRNVVQRIEKIMPYLSYEEDPYMTVVDGKLYWILDAYTTSSYYPYSEPYTGVAGTTNYVRNSIKVIVDAYNGDVDFYVIDDKDPIAVTYQKIYPKLFKSFDKMPEGLKEHLRYPNTLFKIQAGVYTKYHMTETKVFYQKEDLWDIAHQIYGTEEQEMEPSYYIFKLPDNDEAEFINMVPFTPQSKQNMTAIMMARNDGDHYGEMVVYTMPKNKTVYGPMQIEAQIDQNPEISKEFSLWNSSGSKYSRGDLFVIPIGTSLLYVEPVYLEASKEAIPEVKRVIVAYGDRIAYESTFGEALSSLFGGSYDTGASSGSSSGSASSGELTQQQLIAKAQEAYNNAVAAQRSGDWKKYGEYLNELEGYLSKLAQG